MVGEYSPFYSVVIGEGESRTKRVVVDAGWLKEFLQVARLKSSIMDYNPAEIPKDDSLLYHIAQTNFGVLQELEYSLDEALGLIQVPKEEVKEEVPKDDVIRPDELIRDDKENITVPKEQITI
jgi:hypothetical protein